MASLPKKQLREALSSMNADMRGSTAPPLHRSTIASITTTSTVASTITTTTAMGKFEGPLSQYFRFGTATRVDENIGP